MKEIYSVNFHSKPGKKVHTFWFTDLTKVTLFAESLSKNPKVLDFRIFKMPADMSDIYKEGMPEDVTLVEL